MRTPTLLILAGLSMAAPARADVLAIVDGTPVTQADVKRTFNEVKAAAGPGARSIGALVARKLNDISFALTIERTILGKAARKAGMDQDPEIKAAMRSAGRNRSQQDAVLHGAWLAGVGGRFANADDEKLAAFYDHAVTAPRYSLRFLHFANEGDAISAASVIKDKAAFDAALAHRKEGKVVFPNADVINYGRSALDETSPAMQVFLAASHWAWNQVGIDIGAGAVGTVGAPVCEALLCSIWIIDNVETSPPREFETLSQAERASLIEMRADIAARATYAEALRSSEVIWKTNQPSIWKSLIGRPVWTEE